MLDEGLSSPPRLKQISLSPLGVTGETNERNAAWGEKHKWFSFSQPIFPEAVVLIRSSYTQVSEFEAQKILAQTVIHLRGVQPSRRSRTISP